RLAEIWDDLPRAVQTVTGTPARVAGLADRGALQVGLRGDVVRVRKLGATPLLRGVWRQGHRVG
ncbi:MAG: alpha-D-ribose 1-methylphosphonate 5-triphosphate diphosphatase, partial [Pseudomonadota bacterium]